MELRPEPRGVITRDDWLKALGDAVTPVEPDALTVRELSEMFGVPRKTMEERLRKMVESGKARRTLKYVRNAVGHPRRVSAYVLIQ